MTDLLVAVYRKRNRRTVRALVKQATKAGAEVRLWALDAPARGLGAWTLGIGPGTKFALVNRLLATAPVPDDAYVVVADDDVRLPRNGLARFLTLVREAGLDLAQPAHSRRGSHLSHVVTLAVADALVRRTEFVEIGPLFAVAPRLRPEVLPFPDDVGMGWGLEADWYGLARAGAVLGVVDAVPMRHLAPVATTYAQAGERERMAERLAAQGLRSLDDIQHTLAAWPSGAPRPPWL